MTNLGNLQTKAQQINRVLAELGITIDASISSGNGGVGLVGFKESHNFSFGKVSKSELYRQLNTTLEVLYVVSSQLRLKVKE